MGALDMISCGTVGPLVKEKLTKIETQLEELQEQKRKLLLLMQSCKGDCSTTLDGLTWNSCSKGCSKILKILGASY